MINYLLLKIAENKNNPELFRFYWMLLNEAIKLKLNHDHNSTNKESI
jgi:hypothetical protein